MSTDDERRWATLTADALEDETRHNARWERRLLLLGLVAAAVTVVVLLLHGVVA
ncbi:hypothetical protein Cch01nite_44270 [Cellulomonas chitinilytica]|uniref:Uncharacterized protein n=1 Tax=Cellulomonas chitinilytica TaxID=398759 RepID=A0A919P5N7_9CELL|nr:hypothetical protein [Cellulomonas chitinilytica]GIG23703.1 hypothetical protein Cch01nite_44270 [Cellulomonas chitinilytica]